MSARPSRDHAASMPDRKVYCTPHRVGGLARAFFQRSEECRPAPQLAGEAFNGTHGGGAKVMFHPFDVVMNHLFVEAEKLKEIGQQLVPAGDAARERLARGSEDESAILFVFEQAFAIQPLDHVADTRL